MSFNKKDFEVARDSEWVVGADDIEDVESQTGNETLDESDEHFEVMAEACQVLDALKRRLADGGYELLTLACPVLLLRFLRD